jgi:hypothetical protein
VWEALRDQLPDDAALFHSLQLQEQGREFEADLVVAWPDVGVAVLEVKGGRVGYLDGRWTQGDRNGSHPISDPVVQAQDAKHALSRYLGHHDGDLARARFAHLVAFPYTEVPRAWATPGCPRELVIDATDIDSTATIVKRTIEDHGTGHRPLTSDETSRLVMVLTAQFEGQTSLLSAAAEHEHRVDQMTRDQAKIVRVLRNQRRLKVVGGAGTGKTWLALEQARRLVAEGERVALLCYSRGLTRFFERVVATWPTTQRPAYVGLFHGLPLQWGASPPPDRSAGADAQSSYYETELPAQMMTLAGALPSEERFDSIVIDEAQDFGEAWWPPTVACLRDRDAGGLYAFLDEAQRIFNRYGEVPIPLPAYVLDENIRNTKRIAQTFGSLGSEQSHYRGLEGPPVRFVQCATDGALDAADDEVARLVDEGWPPGHVALLTTGRRHVEQVEVVETYGGWDDYWDLFFAETDVFYGHVLGFKGLERPAVVLAVNGLRDERRAKEMLYVGLSRARTQLVVCGDLAEIARHGGEGLRRRLMAASV